MMWALEKREADDAEVTLEDIDPYEEEEDE